MFNRIIRYISIPNIYYILWFWGYIIDLQNIRLLSIVKAIQKPRQQIDCSSSFQMPTLPVCDGAVPAKGKVDKVGAMTKVFFPHCKLNDFPEEPEKACISLEGFLSMWYAERLSKPEGRKALGIANTKLSVPDKDAILGRLQLYKQWLQRKRKNLKSGEKTDLAILHILKSLGADVQQAVSEEPEKGCKPQRRLRQKTPDKKTEPEAEEALVPAEGTKQVFGESKAAEKTVPGKGKFVMLEATPSSPGLESSEHGQEADAMELVSVKSNSSGYIPATQLAMGSRSKTPCKRPASRPGGPAKKKPAMAAKEPASKALKQSWLESGSFGLVKATKATEKAYIQAKENAESKAYCLVNISLGKGSDQDSVMEAVLAEARKEGQTKAQLVEFKNTLMKKL